MAKTPAPVLDETATTQAGGDVATETEVKPGADDPESGTGGDGETVTETEVEKSDKAREKREREALAEIVGDKTPEKPETIEDILGETGEATATDTKTEESETDEDVEAESFDPVKVYKRDNFTEDEIAKIRKALGEEAFMKAAAKKAKRQADHDARFEEETDADPEESDGEDSSTVPTRRGDILDPTRVKAIETMIDEGFDEDKATSLKAELKALRDTVAAGRKTAIQHAAQVVNQMYRSAVADLAGEFPILASASEAQINALKTTMNQLDPQGIIVLKGQRAFNNLVRRATAATFVDAITKDARASVLASNRQTRTGQMSAPRSVAAPASALTPAQFEHAMFRVVQSARKNGLGEKAVADARAKLLKRLKR